MLDWFKKKEPKHDGGMRALRAAVQKKKDVAERILNRPRLVEFDEEKERRSLDLPIDFMDRRSSERRQLPA